MSAVKKCPILSSSDRFSRIKLNFWRQSISFCFFYAAVGERFCHRVSLLIVFVHFKYFEDNSFCFSFPFIFYVINNFWILPFTVFIFFRKQNMSIKCKPSVYSTKSMFFSKSWTVCTSVESAIITLLLFLCMQLLNELAELHFRGLNLKFSFGKFALDSKILHKMIVQGVEVS